MKLTASLVLSSGAKEEETGIVRFTPYTPINLEDGDDNLPITEQHVSAYPNESSGSVHLHHTYNVDHPEIYKLDHSHVSKRVGESFAQVAMSMSVPLRMGRVPDIVKPKYKIENIPKYSAIRNLLVLSYVVSSIDVDLPDLSGNGVALLELKFSKIKIGFYYTYVNMLSYFRGRVSSISTSMPRVNDGEVFQFEGSKGYNKEGFTSIIMMGIGNIIYGCINQINSDAIKFIGDDTEPFFVDDRFILNATDPRSIISCYIKKDDKIFRRHVLRGELRNFELM